jgi:rfaE bifunctional protein nucleotidyltransferase chain/domain
MMPTPDRKIKTFAEARAIIAGWKLHGWKVVFTNGVFDLLHRGHVTLLCEAASLGNKLVVGVNSDASARSLGKGPERPINKDADRAYVLAGLAAVDLVVIFDTPTPYALIHGLKPDVLVKGGDYDPHITDKAHPKYIVGSDVVRNAGGEVAAIQLVQGYSTTSVVRKLANGKG